LTLASLMNSSRAATDGDSTDSPRAAAPNGPEAGEQLQGLAHPDLVVQVAPLELDPDPLAQLVPVPPGVEPEHADAAPVGGAQPLDQLNGGGLAGPVGADDPEDLARLDGQRHVLDGHRVPQIGHPARIREPIG